MSIEADYDENNPLDARGILKMKGQFKKATKEPHEYIKFHMTENMRVWYIMVGGFDGEKDEFKNGEYIFKIILPASFPNNPPRFYSMTPNGLYKPNAKICISIGEYHKDNYRAALGVIGFAMELVNGMIGWRSMGSGINLVKTNDETKKKYAEESTAYNKKYNRQIREDILATYEEYSTAYALKKSTAKPEPSTAKRAPSTITTAAASAVTTDAPSTVTTAAAPAIPTPDTPDTPAGRTSQ